MAYITHTSPDFSSYQANPDYLLAQGISDAIFLNFENSKVSVPLEKRYIKNSNDFDLITPINFQETILETDMSLDDICSSLKETGCVSFYLQSKNHFKSSNNPLINIERFRTNYYFDLEKNESEILSGFKKDARSRLKKAIKTISYGVSLGNNCDEFHEHYTSISINNDFSENYRFSLEQFTRFIETRNIIYIELNTGSDFVSGGIFGVNSHEVDYLYGANNPVYADSIRLLLWEAIRYFRQQGKDRLFLGGGISEGDSLAMFKSRMGTEEQLCTSIRAILDLEKAEYYMAGRFEQNWFSGFFPPYSR